MPSKLLKKRMSKGGEAEQEGVHIGLKPKSGSSMAGEVYRGSEKSAPEHKKEYLKDIAYSMHKNKLEELKKMPSPKLLSKGGMAYQSECTEGCNQPCEVHEMGEDLVGQVLSKRMSKGGLLANEDEPIADSMPNEFDYLEVEGGLEHGELGSNEYGDTDPDKAHNQMVAEAMMKRRKQRNPSPA